MTFNNINKTFYQFQNQLHLNELSADNEYPQQNFSNKNKIQQYDQTVHKH